MGHGHSRPAGWSCRFVRVCARACVHVHKSVCVCMCVCVCECVCVCPVHSSAPETFPTLRLCGSSSTHPQVLEPQAHRTEKSPKDEGLHLLALWSRQLGQRRFPLCLNAFTCHMVKVI